MNNHCEDWSERADLLEAANKRLRGRVESLKETIDWGGQRIMEMERILKFLYGRAIPNEHTSEGAWTAMITRIENLDILESIETRPAVNEQIKVEDTDLGSEK